MNASLQRLVRDASVETRYQIECLLRQDADDHAWAEQLGPAYRQGDVARLLGKSRQAVSADRGLLRLEMRDGELGYPVFQFEGKRQLPGIREIVRTLAPSAASSRRRRERSHTANANWPLNRSTQASPHSS